MQSVVMLDSWNILVIPFAARCRFPSVRPLLLLFAVCTLHPHGLRVVYVFRD
jgi:hypothetical protein